MMEEVKTQTWFTNKINMWVEPKMVINYTAAPLRSDQEREETSSRLEVRVVYLAIDFIWRGSLKLKYMWAHGQWQGA